MADTDRDALLKSLALVKELAAHLDSHKNEIARLHKRLDRHDERHQGHDRKLASHDVAHSEHSRLTAEHDARLRKLEGVGREAPQPILRHSSRAAGEMLKQFKQNVRNL